MIQLFAVVKAEGDKQVLVPDPDGRALLFTTFLDATNWIIDNIPVAEHPLYDVEVIPLHPIYY